MKLTGSISRLFSTYTTTQKSERVAKNSISLNPIKELHAHLFRTHLYTDPSSVSAVIKSYALYPPTLPKAHFVFNQIEWPTLLVWNHMIRGLTQSEQPSDAICFYNRMYHQGLAGDNLTLIFVFKACARVSDIVHGKKCNRFKEVLGLFKAMQAEHVKADKVTMMKVILACSYLSEWEIADSMVKYIEENHVVVDAYLGNTMIDMYGRRGYSQANQFADAVRLFQEMMAAKVKPDEITVASVLSACAHLGSLDVGEAVHDYIHKHGVKADVYVGNVLIDMYCKCGVVEKALEVFQEMKKKDYVSWNSVISGLAVNGFADSALELFSQMLRDGVQPTHGAFVGILLACSHAGLVDKGLEYFESMEKVHRLTPEMKHYGCVVDILSRSGNLDRAYLFIKKMPIVPDVVVWRILLSACKLHGNMVLAEIARNKLLELEPGNSGNYVLSSHAYASSYRWDDVIKMRELMEESNVQKPFGCSSIEVNGTTLSNSQDLCLIQS
ncbi:pentatricopeptide repeat-containing protein At2g22410, mitochondrial-like [Fagus crenata]